MRTVDPTKWEIFEAIMIIIWGVSKIMFKIAVVCFLFYFAANAIPLLIILFLFIALLNYKIPW